MDEYDKFKDAIEEIKSQLDTFLFCLDDKKTSNPDETVEILVEQYLPVADFLKQSMQALAKAKGNISIKDISYNGKFRD